MGLNRPLECKSGLDDGSVSRAHLVSELLGKLVWSSDGPALFLGALRRRNLYREQFLYALGGNSGHERLHALGCARLIPDDVEHDPLRARRTVRTGRAAGYRRRISCP